MRVYDFISQLNMIKESERHISSASLQKFCTDPKAEIYVIFYPFQYIVVFHNSQNKTVDLFVSRENGGTTRVLALSKESDMDFVVGEIMSKYNMDRTYASGTEQEVIRLAASALNKLSESHTEND